MSEPRLYLYRKAGREVWDAEMWLPDGRRRVWRTGIADKGAAMAAAQVRLEVLAAVQTVAPIEIGCTVNECAPVVSQSVRERDSDPLAECAEAPLCAAGDAQASAGELAEAHAASCKTRVALASEEHAQALQTPQKTQEMGALAGFDRWFFSDLRRVFGGEST